MSRFIKLVASQGTDVKATVWKNFVNCFVIEFTGVKISGGLRSDYIEAEMHVGGFPDLEFYVNKFKQFEGSNIYLELYDLEVEPESTHTL
jgi:hypothetical protein